MVQINFNAAQVQPNKAPEPVPSGMYPVIITNSARKPTSKGGEYLEFEMTIQPPHEHAGKKVFDRLNIVNASQQTVDIAYSTLSSLCHVTGRMQIQDTTQLHGAPFIAVVSKVERNDRPGSGEMTNTVRGYKDINGNEPGFAGQPQGGGQPSWANGGNAPQQVQQAVQQEPVQQVQQAPVQQQPQQVQPVQQVQTQPVQQQVQPAGGDTDTPPWLRQQG